MKHYIQPIALSAALILLASCGNNGGAQRPDIASPVSVVELKPSSISKFINTTGTAKATYEADLNSEIAGLYHLQTNPATGRPFKLGDRVKQGQLIVRLEDREYMNGIALDSKEMNLELARQKRQSQDTLYQKGGVTALDLRNSEVAVIDAEYSVDNARISLEKMNVRAPFDGIIVTLPHYTPGARVEQGKPMVSLMSYDKMFMEINMPESAINQVRTGQSAAITHYTLPYDTIPGTVSELSPAINTETRTFGGKLLIDNGRLMLRPGMFVKADIKVDQADNAIVIPKDVILSNRRRKYVFIVEKNTAVIRDIRTGIEDEDNIQVTDGLKPGDNLVVRGYETLRENSKVKVLK
ncbi:MAG: efflux RND transporter periplasmic adaptor subunit [Rikenellaceae bacterium]|nr:efflux RND transporter periplasmic adaptor subunit [Rikenellaceae bacterium]